MAECKIAVEDKPSTETRDAIVALLRAYNWTKVEKPIFEPLAIVLRDSQSDEIIGGLWGESYGGWLYVDSLIVPETLRKSGKGTLLMKEAEAIARKRGCIGIWLDTHTFQTPAFYEKLDYQLLGKLRDFPPGYDKHYYFKRIAP